MGFSKGKKFFLFLGLIFGLISGLLLAIKLDIMPKTEAIQASKQTTLVSKKFSAASLPAGKMDMCNAFVKVADKIGSAVVSISSERIQKISGRRQFRFGPGPGSGFFGDDSFNEFFRDFFGDMPEREFKQMGLGSGVIIDPAGYILTNEHVISGAEKVTVSLSDGREFEAAIKGTDPRSDLAIIKIDNEHDLPFAALGNSDIIQTGEWVVAIGNPFGFAVNSPEPTVTVGVVSAMHRSLPGMPGGRGRERAYLDLIQTDAAINPGNSGGPLCNLNGEVIGINVAIVSTTGGYQGLGFAIPSNIAKRIVDDLIKGKEVVYGWMGITVQEITKDIADYFGLKEKTGVLVSGILKKGPAARAGIKAGDIIIKIGNRKIEDIRDVLRKIGSAKPGDKIKVIIMRDKKEMALSLIVGKRPMSPEDTKALEKIPEDAKETAWRGLGVRDITPEIARKTGIEDTDGVLISSVEHGSPAYNAGLRRGNIIRAINKISVKNKSDYNKAVSNVKGDTLVRTDRGFVIVKEQ